MGLRRLTNRIGPDLRRKAAKLAPIPKLGYDHFRKVTPIDTGNAKNSTAFSRTTTGGKITANYNYANRLNAGYSKQAPNGMTEPTIEELKRQVKRVI